MDSISLVYHMIELSSCGPAAVATMARSKNRWTWINSTTTPACLVVNYCPVKIMHVDEIAVFIDRNCKAVSMFYPALTVKASITCLEDTPLGPFSGRKCVFHVQAEVRGGNNKVKRLSCNLHMRFRVIQES